MRPSCSDAVVTHTTQRAVGVGAADGVADVAVADRDVLDGVGHVAGEDVGVIGGDRVAALEPLRAAGRVLGIDDLDHGVVRVQPGQQAPRHATAKARRSGRGVEGGGGGDGGHGGALSRAARHRLVIAASTPPNAHDGASGRG